MLPTVSSISLQDTVDSAWEHRILCNHEFLQPATVHQVSTVVLLIAKTVFPANPVDVYPVLILCCAMFANPHSRCA